MRALGGGGRTSSLSRPSSGRVRKNERPAVAVFMDGVMMSPSFTKLEGGRSVETPLFPEDASIDRSRPTAEQIYVLLRRAIVSWRLRPGDTISDTMITHRFQVSRTPLREAS